MVVFVILPFISVGWNKIIIKIVKMIHCNTEKILYWNVMRISMTIIYFKKPVEVKYQDLIQ